MLMLSTAHATPVTWSWPATEAVAYHIETKILTPRGIRYYGTKNLDVIGGSVHLSLATSCTSKPQGKATLVTCTLAHASVTGDAQKPYEQEEFDRILVEWSEMLGASSVEFIHSRDGRLRDFDVKYEAAREDPRINALIQAQRILLQRAFCAFDLPLPTDDDDWKRGWRHKGDPQIMHLMTSTGTTGVADIDQKHEGSRYGLVVVSTSGRGTMGVGGAFDSDQGSALLNDIRVVGESLFDPANGQLAYRDFTLDGRLTSSSHMTGSDVSFYQALAAQRITAAELTGVPPIPISAQRATKVDKTASDLPPGVALVPFTELGMQPLFVQGLPESGTILQLPTSMVRARVLVGPDGIVKSAEATSGYEVLAKRTEDALASTAFPKRDAAYAVEVEVEWRP